MRYYSHAGLDNVKFDLVPVPLTLGISVVHFELRLNTSSACIEGTIDAGRIRVDNLRVEHCSFFAMMATSCSNEIKQVSRTIFACLWFTCLAAPFCFKNLSGPICLACCGTRNKYTAFVLVKRICTLFCRCTVDVTSTCAGTLILPQEI